MEEVLFAAVAKWPVVSSVLIIMGGLRFLFKPIMSAAEKYVAYTPSLKDDAFFKKLTESKIYKGVAWLVDFFGSIKLPKAKKE